ncbi:MAG TPA: DUF1549 domain-containing protein [Pirellulaceae bacterium]|nr:DUF1549 domain-containing protein [Pirellulaceae bacterium]
MWMRNILFLALCVTGLALVGRNLLDRDRVDTPRDFRSGRLNVTPASAAPDGAEKGQTTAADLAVVVAKINQEFRDHWREKGLSPAARADDLAIARRLSLALTGTIPSLEEIRELEKVRPADRVNWWLAHLLEDRRYADYVAERLARAYVGTENGPFIVYRRRRFVTWLADQLEKKTPYDAIVRELIADTGLWNAEPAVNFLTVTARQQEGNRPDEVRLAARTTRAFLGMRIDCLQCHDDRLGNVTLGAADEPRGGKQADFHQLAAFFGQARTGLTGIQDDPKRSYQTKYLEADKEEVVAPQVPYGEEIFDGRGTRRQQLARWVTNPNNKPFARATANRLWAILFGRALLEPVDSIPLFGKYPPGLETLAEDFISHGYDVKRLIAIIAATDVYQLDSKADFEVTPAHEQEWAVFPVTRMRPEQVAGAVIQASSLTTINADAHIFSQLGKFIQTNQFVERYGDLGEDEFIDRGGTIPQRLLMMNGELVKERTDQNPVQNAATRIAMVTPKNHQAVETAYLVTLTRRPTPAELAHFTKRLADREERNRAGAMEDLYWVLLNSTEFSWNH